VRRYYLPFLSSADPPDLSAWLLLPCQTPFEPENAFSGVTDVYRVVMTLVPREMPRRMIGEMLIGHSLSRLLYAYRYCLAKVSEGVDRVGRWKLI
jgi:hypothetical protein